jgi:hypothetical protein
MTKIEKELYKKLSLIVDRYIKLNTSFIDIKRYLNGKNLNIIITELYDIEYQYLKQNNGKNEKDFKKLVKYYLSILLKDRELKIKEDIEKLNNIKKFENINSIKNKK